MSDRSEDLQRTIGPYHLLEVLGEGGMGVVYRAQQLEPIRREVALKLIRPGVDSERVVARFQTERQSLAVMEHPCIASILDAGTTDEGRPFFVMELVRGQSLLEHCDARRVAIRERIEMVVQVCRAVQHAHRKGVIHRDLKPSNIMVTEAGERPLPKIIDFGIAKLVEADRLDGDPLTRVDESTGTPAYMSPEQTGLVERDVDTRADIYSLGVILYQLLVGELPFGPRAYQGWAAFVAAAMRDPPRPSRRFAELSAERREEVADARGTDPGHLARWLGSDLDWIIMRCLEKEPDRRYETVNGLAMDLERFLEHKPVVARPPSRAYLARKFVRRNPLGAGLGAALAVLLAAFAGIQTYQAGVIAAALEETALRKGQAEDLIDYALGDLRAKLEPLGRLDILDDVSRQSMQYFASLPTDEFDDVELLRRSEALSQLGQVRLEQGRRDEALLLFEEALRLHDALVARDPSQGDWQYALGAALFWVGYVHYMDGRLDEAEAPFLEYLAISERLVELDDANLDWVQELSYANSNMGSLYEARADLEGAARAFERTLAIDSTLVRLDPDSPDRLLDFARSHNTLGGVYQQLGRLAEATRLHESEVALNTALADSDPQNMVWARDLARSRRFLGSAHLMMGRPARAAEPLDAAVQTLTFLHRRDTTDLELRRELGGALDELGVSLAESGRVEEGIEMMEQAVALLSDLHRRDRSNADWSRLLASGLVSQARVLELRGSVAMAARSALEAVDLVGSMADTDVAAARTLAAAHVVLGRLSGPSEAAAHWNRAVSILEGRPDAALVARATLAEALLRLGRHEDAQPLLERLDAAQYAAPQYAAARVAAGTN